MNDLINSTRAELLRLRKWPAVWITIGAWAAMALMFGYLFNYIAYKTGDDSFSNEGESPAQLLHDLLPASMPDVLVQGLPLWGGALAMVLGAIVAGNGYGWGTWKTTFTQGPSRSSSVAGSMIALVIIEVGVMVMTLALMTATSVSIAAGEGQSIDLPSAGALLKTAGGGLLVLEMWALMGYALGTLARGPALSVGLGLVWALVVENLLRGVGSLLGPIESFTHVLPGTAGGSLIGALLDVGNNPTDVPGVLDTVSGGQALVTVLVYAVALPVVALVLVRRRDVV
jgi:ABC-type transport system involved in multi-copper enzyme maturation permease subunit